MADGGHQGGTRVTAHCFTSQGARNAIEGGVTCIEHGALIDDGPVTIEEDGWARAEFSNLLLGHLYGVFFPGIDLYN